MTTTIPQVETHLPELIQFAKGLASAYQNGTLTGRPELADRVRAFYTPAMMEKVERVIPGWGRMASFANQITLIHVTSVLTALYLLPEYQQATLEHRALMEWAVLFHDVAKEARRGEHDYVHGFRSAAIAGKAFAQIGFPVTEAYTAEIEPWAALTHNAIRFHEGHQEHIQDNSKLPQIIAGIARLYGENAPAGLVIKAILFHMSIVTDPEYPTLAPLTETETRQFIDSTLYPVFKMMMLVDVAGWDLFDTDTHQRHRQQTLDAFDAIQTRLLLPH